jgi:Cu-processing system ATP-binding protein
MIRINGLTKRFGRLHVLQGLDLDIERGCVTAIVGPNGAGKTTLIKSILGLTQPDGGKILVNGERVDRVVSRYREAIGYMPQIARFPDNLTAADLIAMLKDLRGDEATIDEDLIERFTLEPHLRKPLRTLSGGTRQKVNAVMAFLFTPRLLILDEPTSGLDPVSSGVLKDKILEMRAEGRTVIVSSHVMSELDELAERVVILLEGRTKYAGSVHDLKLDTRQLSLERAVAELMLREAAA